MVDIISYIITDKDHDNAQYVISEVNKRRSYYKPHEFFTTSQKGEKKKSMDESIFNLNSRLLHYLLAAMDYDNFALFNPTHLSKELNVSRTSIYASKKALINGRYIREVYNSKLGAKGVQINQDYAKKGKDPDDQEHIVPLSEYKES